jgi:HD-like signal output (HDOD) protein
VSEQDKKQELLKNLSNIEPLPAIIIQLTDLIEQDNPDINSIVRVLETEIGMTTRLLRIANSPFFGFQRQVSSLNEAIVMLGLTDLKNLVMSFVIVQQFEEAGIWDILDQDRFWQHSMAVAGLNATLAALTGDEQIKGDAFTLGIIHRLGMCVLAHSFPKEYTAALSNTSILEHNEFAELGLDHHEVGGLICQHWNLPARFAIAVTLSEGDVAARVPDKTACLARMLGLSIHLAPILGYGSPRFVPVIDIAVSLASLGILRQPFLSAWEVLPSELLVMTHGEASNAEAGLSGVNLVVANTFSDVDLMMSLELFRLALAADFGEEKKENKGQYILHDGSVDVGHGEFGLDISPFITVFDGHRAVNWVALRQALLLESQNDG